MTRLKFLVIKKQPLFELESDLYLMTPGRWASNQLVSKPGPPNRGHKTYRVNG